MPLMLFRMALKNNFKEMEPTFYSMNKHTILAIGYLLHCGARKAHADLPEPSLLMYTNIKTFFWTILKLSPIYESRSDRRDLLAIKVKSVIFTEKERPSCCEQ